MHNTSSNYIKNKQIKCFSISFITTLKMLNNRIFNQQNSFQKEYINYFHL